MNSTVLRKLSRGARGVDLTWRYLFNFKPTLSYKLARRDLSGEASRVLAELNRYGIAITSASRLLADDACYKELAATVDTLEEGLANKLAGARARADSAGDSYKSFLYEFLGEAPELEPTSVFARFALQYPILQIANEYFGMYTQLRYYNVWHTFITRSRARQSQLWHRDREDRQILKVFAYFSDVDEGSGPLTYAAASHLKGSLRRQPAYTLEGDVRRSDDTQMAEVVPPAQWVKGVGRRGTIVFADTHGYHKGGLARERDRVMYVCKFTSQAGRGREFHSYPREVPTTDKARSFALRKPERQSTKPTRAGKGLSASPAQGADHAP